MLLLAGLALQKATQYLQHLQTLAHLNVQLVQTAVRLAQIALLAGLALQKATQYLLHLQTLAHLNAQLAATIVLPVRIAQRVAHVIQQQICHQDLVYVQLESTIVRLA
ncbi:unnamed protein product [Blepharisma stoltei]|uniref:Secreted protein n=1 Tax=Blepharisma stoltei TaxID=1481888 RepID=A0AAU9J018_9CILI|nr:unnamed protein product [Blepharisma stoltei]